MFQLLAPSASGICGMLQLLVSPILGIFDKCGFHVSRSDKVSWYELLVSRAVLGPLFMQLVVSTFVNTLKEFVDAKIQCVPSGFSNFFIFASKTNKL